MKRITKVAAFVVLVFALLFAPVSGTFADDSLNYVSPEGGDVFVQMLPLVGASGVARTVSANGTSCRGCIIGERWLIVADGFDCSVVPPDHRYGSYLEEDGGYLSLQVGPDLFTEPDVLIDENGNVVGCFLEPTTTFLIGHLGHNQPERFQMTILFDN